MEEQTQGVRKRSFAGLAKSRRLKDVLPPGTKKILIIAMVLPLLGYRSVVWQECTKTRRGS